MQIKYLCTYWGQEQLRATDFINNTKADGYDGVEINLPTSETFQAGFLSTLAKIRVSNPEFVFVAQHVPDLVGEMFETHLENLKVKLADLAFLEPAFINSHTGKDYYSFDENCQLIEAALTVSEKTGIRILHETHRGRFSFHADTMLRYLEKFPEMELVGDFSHWCTVSESMMQGQEEILEQIFPHVAHIHARIGFEQGPQVNDPRAPEWDNHTRIFINWWNRIIEVQQQKGRKLLTICPEFGPPPYMPVSPSQRPVANQVQVNRDFKEMLKDRLILPKPQSALL